MTEFTEGFHTGEHLVSEANGYRSREAGIITGGKYQAGTVLGRITAGGAVTVTKTDVGGGKGALTLANPAYGAGVKAGRYKVIIVEEAENAGAFIVEDPDGITVGSGNVAVAFNGVVKFTLADATDFAAGDTAFIDVAIADPADVGKYTQFDPDATDGSQHFAGVLYEGVDASENDVAATVHVRDCEVNGLALTWIDEIEDEEKAAAIAEAAALGVIVRN